jgi:carboxymethylenebutenolidase
MHTEKLQIQVGGETMGAYLALPDGAGPHPAVIVFQEIFGVNSHIRDVTERVAKLGYVAIAPDYHHRSAPGQELKYDQEGMQKGMPLIGKLVQANVIADIEATLATLAARNDVRHDRTGCIGFCIGGHVAYLAATTGHFQATASFYGGGIAKMGLGAPDATVTRTKLIKGKIVCFFGEKDGAIPPDQVQQIRHALDENHINHEVVVYEPATHGFFCDQRGSYHQPSAADAWQRVQKLFAEELR